MLGTGRWQTRWTAVVCSLSPPHPRSAQRPRPGRREAGGVKEVVLVMGDHLSAGGVLVPNVATGSALGSCEGWDGGSAVRVVDIDGDGADEIKCHGRG